MYENLNGVQHKSAVIDVTDTCNLRCRHSLYFREEHDSRDMSSDDFLEGLKILKNRHNILSMGWSGGEPLYKPEVVSKGSKLFKMNQLFINGTLPISKISNLLTFISLDGTRKLNDNIKGKGTYDKVMQNLEKEIIFFDILNK